MTYHRGLGLQLTAADLARVQAQDACVAAGGTRESCLLEGAATFGPVPELDAEEGFFDKKLGPVPVWALGLGGIAVVGGGAAWFLLRKKKPKKNRRRRR
jgi:hypothetical protein